MDDTVTLRAIYREGAPPDHYRVEARGGALTADCPDFQTALAYFTRWTEGEV